MTFPAQSLRRLTAAPWAIVGALLVGLMIAGMPSTKAQEAAPSEPTLEERRDAAMQACLNAGTAADECDCGMAYLRANLNDNDEAFVLEILASLAVVEPAAFADSMGMSEAELNAEILRLQPTLAELGSSCG